jgi:hypothetical protein
VIVQKTEEFKYTAVEAYGLAWIRFFIEKLAVSQLVKKNFPHFMEPEGLYRIYKTPPLVPILSQFNPVHAFSIDVLKIHFNLIVPPASTEMKNCNQF